MKECALRGGEMMLSHRSLHIEKKGPNDFVTDIDKSIQNMIISRLQEDMPNAFYHKGYSWLRKFRGSSSYTSTEMSKFLDNIIFEAQELGIETDTTGYVSELKNNWKEKQLG